jgi:antimicrobial peptide system SdpB family protein
MLTPLGRMVRLWVCRSNPWTNVYGCARTLLAASTALTLMFNSSATLFRPIAGVRMQVPYCELTSQKLGIFCLAHGHVDVTRWLAVGLLAMVASGWRPRITGPIHWWIASSFQASASTIDGGDQTAAVLALLLLPIALTDRRKWHWSSPSQEGVEGEWSRLLALSALVAIRLQVAAIYFHAAVAKMSVREWENGTAVYYWFTHPVFGGNHYVMTFLRPLITNSIGVATITWGTIILEFALTMGLFATRTARRVLLPLGIGFHLAIIVIHGLFSFAVTMFAALILYLRPMDEFFHLPQHVSEAVLLLKNGLARRGGRGHPTENVFRPT